MAQQRVKDPTLWMIIGYVLGMVILLLVVSCGSRKTDTSIRIEKDSEKTTDSQSSQGSVGKSETSSQLSTEVKQTDKVDEKQESRVRELFNENGTLKERITELLNSKSTDKSSEQKSLLIYVHTNQDSIFNNMHYITRDINHYLKAKDKKTDANNNALYWMLFGLGIVVIVAVFVYMYLKNRVVPKIEK